MENKPAPGAGDGEKYSSPANAPLQAVELIRESLRSLHQAFPSLVSKNLLDDGRPHGDVLQVVSHAKDVLLRHVDQFEAVEALLLQLGAQGPQAEQAQHQHTQEGPAGKLGEQQHETGARQGNAAAPQLSYVPLASSMTLPGPSVAASATSDSQVLPPHISHERTKLHQPQKGHVPPSRGSSSSSFYGVRPSPGRASSSSFPGLHHPEHAVGDVSSTSRLASSIAALAQAQQQQQQQQRPSPPYHHLQPHHHHPTTSSSTSSFLPSGSSETSGFDPELLRILSLEPSISDLSPTASAAGPPSRQSFSSQGVVTPPGACMPAAVQAAPGTAAAAAAAAAAASMPNSSLQILHKQPRRVHSSLPYHWHAMQHSTAPTLEHPHGAVQAWPSMAPYSSPVLGTNNLLPNTQLTLFPPAPHSKPQRHQSFNAVGLLQQHQPLQQAAPLTQQQQQQLLLLSQLAKQQQQQQQQRQQTHASVPGQPQVLQRSMQQRQQQGQGGARPSLGSRPAAFQDSSVNPLLLSQLEELQQPMPAIGLGASGPMAPHLAGNLQDIMAVSGGLDSRAAGLEGDGLIRGVASSGAHPIMAGHSQGSAGPRATNFGVVGTGSGSPGGWGPGAGLGVVEKKEGNKRSGASRRRKAKMYQSLNAMVQSVLDDDSHADLSAASVLANSAAMLSDPLLYQSQLLAAQQQQHHHHQQQQQQQHQQQQHQQQQQQQQARPPDTIVAAATLGASSAPSSKGSSSNASGEGAGLYINVGAGLQGSVGLGHGPGTPTDSAPAALAASSVAFSAADSNPNLALPPVKEVLTKPATEPPFPPPHAPPPQWQQPDGKHMMPDSQAYANTL